MEMMRMDYRMLMEAVKAARKKSGGDDIDWDKFFKDMDRRKAREKKAAGAAAVSGRKPFPWTQRGSYWWHPTKAVIPMREYHVKKVVESPQTFGLTAAQVDKAILASAGHDQPKPEVAKNIIASIRAKVMVGSIRVIHEVLALAFAKDWCRVAIQSSIITIAGRKRAIVKALEEYRQSGSMQGNEFGLDIMSDDGTEMLKTMVRRWSEVDRVIDSLR